MPTLMLRRLDAALVARVKDRFWSKVQRGAPTDCWPWMAGRKRKGYGQFHITKRQAYSAHRLAYELTFGPVEGLCVLHRCDNPPCCNPAHLFTGTVADNNADKQMKGRDAHGQQLNNSKITEEIARAIYSSAGTNREIARLFGVSHQQVSRIKTGQCWSHLHYGSPRYQMKITIPDALQKRMDAYARDHELSLDAAVSTLLDTGLRHLARMTTAGHARAASLSAEDRSAIATRAAQARWGHR